jgi:xeroderma pigmentosum group C-complementing protein
MVEIGKFRGEPVYARAAVISLKTAENWMRIGRKVKPGCQPMKWVKPRAATVNKRREIEMTLEVNKSTAADDDAVEDVMQGLYALSQTEMYKPEPIIDVRVLR